LSKWCDIQLLVDTEISQIVFGQNAFLPRVKDYGVLSETFYNPRRAPMKKGRNEPCICGSGKKYKRCCGMGMSEPTPVAAEVVPSVYQPFAAHGISPWVVEAMKRASRQ
jgi:hypothetical protein